MIIDIDHIRSLALLLINEISPEYRKEIALRIVEIIDDADEEAERKRQLNLVKREIWKRFERARRAGDEERAKEMLALYREAQAAE